MKLPPLLRHSIRPWYPALLLLAAAAAYSNVYSGAFLFDDGLMITDAEVKIRALEFDFSLDLVLAQLGLALDEHFVRVIDADEIDVHGQCAIEHQQRGAR